MISIIVPIYNTSRWLPQCIESCLQQSFGDFELILVNDASTDGSLSVCRKYAQADTRVKIINKTDNEGVDKARFTGLSEAGGEYVMFVDSDDWLCNRDILSIMYRKAEETRSDYVEMGMQRVMDRHAWVKRKCARPVTGVIEMPELFERYYISFFGVNILSVNICGKLYRKAVVDKAGLVPTGVVMGEDLAFNMQLFPHLKRIYLLDEVGYSYRFGGMTSKYNPHLLPDLKKLYQVKKSLIERYDYAKASDYIRIELKNVLLSDVCQRIIFTGGREDVCEAISKELSDPLYQDIGELTGHSDVLDSPIVKAILAGDASAIYEMGLARVKSERPARIAKRILSFMLMHI